jgi:hypothetical protein
MADYESIPRPHLRILVSVFTDFLIFFSKTVTGALRPPSYEYEGSTPGVAPN